MRERLRASSLLAVVALVAVVLAACGDDGEETATQTATGGGDNVLTVEMTEYAYDVSGEINEGLVTIRSSNTGDEYHMIGIGKLKPGVDFEEARDGLIEAFQEGGPGGGEEEEETTTTARRGQATTTTARASRSQRQTTTTTAATTTTEEEEEDTTGGGGQEEGEEEDPLAQFFDEELGTPGHFAEPGGEQSITTDVLTAGEYAMICFIPTEGEGIPHAAKGMMAGFEVGDEQSEARAPEADATYTLADNEAPDGPDELNAGSTTLELNSTGELGKDFIIVKPDRGKTFEDVDQFFTQYFEGPEHPPENLAARAPGEIVFNTFAVEGGDTIYLTVDLEAGDYVFVNSTNPEDEEEDEAVDEVLEVTVT